MTMEKENSNECDSDAPVEGQSGNGSPIGTFPLRYHPLTQKMKGLLVRFPRVYSLAVRVYVSIVGVYVLFVRLSDWMRSKLEYKNLLSSFVIGPSRQHISASQGLVQIIATEEGNLITPLPPFEAHYETRQDFSGCTTDIKAIAYHLPQFHAIPENDAWWGEGFTEWSNTRKAKPSFPGHYQPREPHADIGYYDLSDVETLRRQVDMAKQYGIHGFCFYHYWFHGKRLLGKPVDLLLNNADLDMPFCLCWANETWSKKWDGKDQHILIKQEFSPKDDVSFIEFLAPYFRDPRYIRVNNKPLLLVYRVSRLPNPIKTVSRWRTWCRENGIGEIHLVSVCHGEVYPHIPLEKIGFDAYAAFPPHSFPCQHITEDEDLFDGGYRFDYASGIESCQLSHTDTRIYEGCMLGWDNTPRFGKRNVTMFQNFSVQKYYNWLRRVIDYTRATFPEDERLVFINAWNEWAEGAYLEPDRKYGYVYLNTTARALYNFPQYDPAASTDTPDQDSAEKYTQEYEYLKYTIENNNEHSLAAVNRFIENDCEILEFGSAAGYFTRYLAEERGATVDIVELDSHCAEQAAVFARRCCVADVEQYTWKTDFAGQLYDYILFADIIEHLQNPWRALKESIDMLKPAGRIIISVPNIAHVQILASLCNNDFSYADVGIMDNTHLRFFTEPTLRDMIHKAGMEVCDLVSIEMPVLPKSCGTRWNKMSAPAKLWEVLEKKEHAHAIQFVACCQRVE